MTGKIDIARFLEEKTGHKFSDPARLERALTHASARQQAGANYERLEFLGDRVLGLVVAEMLFAAFPKAAEGELSVRLNALVNAETCAAIADEIGLHALIRTGADIKALMTEKRLMNVRADVIEALIAGIYLEGGLDAVRPFIRRYWEPRSRETEAGRRDAKTELQEWAHQQKGAQPRYVIKSRVGPDHDPQFTVEVTVTGFDAAVGIGRSKRIAEQNAAAEILYREGVWQRPDAEEGIE
ncbi:ribonuclease 3 [Brucella endophytica]|uniref:Ribonuclease 3 n=1 Tax=Brucella endophytica TaxID=1963359 RepID=A0A916WFJ4_9HYPH|nr:ribonuclease III [Brucella endophytica]GGA93139.1 ribonuclease 3 [Brucella endophytica]